MALAFYVVIRFSLMGEYRWFFSVLSGALLALNVFALYVLKNSLESDERIRNMELLVRNKQDQLRLFQDMKFLYERQSRKTHDYKKQLSSIQELLENDETESAVSLVRSLTNSLSVDLSGVNTGHPVINAVLNQEYRMAKERGIGMLFAVEDMHDFRKDEEDVVILFGNLLENAINECSRLIEGGVAAPAIQIRLARANDKTVLSVKNPVVSKVEIRDNEIVDPLPPGHGIGLMNVREVVDKYGGDLVLSCDDREFMAVVMI
ncbi:MAG: GHKL domain-containing protein [Butyrivibrio sp.]|nr:GHKL domain-containing protein [Butyrivibrio sp.]